MALSLLSSFVSIFAACALAGYPPTPQDTITVQIPGNAGISISYKQTTICETKGHGYSGFVHLPATALSAAQPGVPYNASMFFWYFPARQNPGNAQTAIYLAGGPGQSSMFGAVRGGGPCTILPDSNSTQANPYSWNEYVNMLYVDQPVGAGYSYDALINSTMDLLGPGIKAIEEYDVPIPAENQTFLYGTFPSQDEGKTAPNSALAARMLWHFSQAWFTSFPEYRTQDKRVSLWGNSYGGYYVPTSAELFQRQNERVRSGEISNGHILDVDTIGWTNGCTDLLYQAEWYPDMAYNNTYGLQVISEDTFKRSKNAFSEPGGCREQILGCREAGQTYDPEESGLNAEVNNICAFALLYCANNVIQGPYTTSTNRSLYDIAHLNPDGFPPQHLIGFFNRAWVQRDLGSPINFTAVATTTSNAFIFTGDAIRTPGMKSLQYLLNNNIKVAMIYGDRDFRCPWLGGEQLSLLANWSGAPSFRQAGYEPIRTNSCYEGGVVRQHGNLSFARVFEAGHDVAAYQPQTVFEIFTRVMLNLDVATGKKTTMGAANNYSSEGPESSFGWKNELPVPPPGVNCNLYNVEETCTEEQYKALANGTAKAVDFDVANG